MQNQCANCEKPFISTDPRVDTRPRWGDSDYCIPCVRACAGAATESHACIVCMDTLTR